MARAHWVKSSRKPHRCHAGHDIPVGEGYYWAAPGFRTSRYGKKFACKAHPFKQSQLTSGLRSEALAAAEDFEAELDGIDLSSSDALTAIEEAVSSFADAIGDYVQQREDALDAWENGNSQLEELRDIAQSAHEEIEGFVVDDWDGDDDARDEGDEDAVNEWEAHVQDQIDNARELAALEF